MWQMPFGYDDMIKFNQSLHLQILINVLLIT